MTEPLAPAVPQDDVLSGAGVSARVVNGGLQRTVGFMALNLITVGGAALLLRHLGLVDFGRYGTVVALLTIVQGVTDAGLTLTGSRELSVARTDEERRHVLSHLIGLRIVITAVGVAAAVGFAAAAGYTTAMIEGTAIAGAGVWILSIQGALLLPLSVQLRNWRLAINDVLRQATLVGCFVVLAFTSAGLVWFLAAQLISALVVLAITPLLVTRRNLVRPRWTGSELRQLTRRTLPLAISGALVVVYFRVLVILISLLEPSARQVGDYVTAERILEVFLTLPVMLVGIALPVLSVSARDDTARLSYVTLRMTQMMAAIGLLFAVVLATGARPILVILGGGQYAGAANVLRIQCFALITVFITQSWTTTLVGMGHARQLAAGTAIGVSAVIALGVVLILAFGADGAAVAAVAADIIYCGSILWFVWRGGAAGSLSAGPFLRLAACAVPGFALAVLSPLPELINCILATVLYLGLLVAARALPPELTVWLARLRAGRRTAALPGAGR